MDSGFQELDSRYSNLKPDSEFLELRPVVQSLGFEIPQAKFSGLRNPDYFACGDISALKNLGWDKHSVVIKEKCSLKKIYLS